MKSYIPILLIGILLLLFVAGLIATVFKIRGDFDVIEPKDNLPNFELCDANHFVEEYGTFSHYFSLTNIDLDGKGYFLLPFDSNFVAIVEPSNGECKFVLDKEKSYKVFEAYFHNKSILNFDKSSYDLFIRCNRADDGADKICHISTDITRIVDSNIIQISAAVPDQIVKKAESRAKQEGWEILALGVDGIKLSKTISAFGNTEYFVIIELTRDISCAAVDPIDLEIFRTANISRPTFYDAKNRIYTSNSVSELDSANLSLSILEQSNGFDIFDFVTNYLTNDAVCNSTNFKQKSQDLYLATKNVKETALFFNESYFSTISALQKRANDQMAIESNIKNRYLLNLGNFLKIWSWTVFLFHNSGSANEFDLGHYKKAEMDSFQGTIYYNFYWDKTGWIDYIPTILLFATIIGSILWIIRQPPQQSYY